MLLCVGLLIAAALCRFDLSPKNIERKLGSKAEIAKLMHMVFKVASELQPSVIYIDEVEKLFTASKSKSKSAGDCGKLRAPLLTHKSFMSQASRILVIGNTRQPFHEKLERKDFIKFFGPFNSGKMLYTPCPNYATRLKLWRHFINETGLNCTQLEKYHKFDLTTLAKISEGYSAGSVSSKHSTCMLLGSIVQFAATIGTVSIMSCLSCFHDAVPCHVLFPQIQQAILSTLPARRVQKFLENGRQLDSNEFISALSKTPYVYKNDYANFLVSKVADSTDYAVASQLHCHVYCTNVRRVSQLLLVLSALICMLLFCAIEIH